MLSGSGVDLLAFEFIVLGSFEGTTQVDVRLGKSPVGLLRLSAGTVGVPKIFRGSFVL